MEEIQEVLGTSPERGEEWAIHDYEGFGGLTIHEYEPIERVAELAQLIEEHGPAFATYADNVGTDYTTEDDFLDHYQGEWDSEKAYGENLFDELYLNEVPEHVRPYIDYESFTRDLFLDGYYSTRNPDGGIFVFTH